MLQGCSHISCISGSVLSLLSTSVSYYLPYYLRLLYLRYAPTVYCTYICIASIEIY